MKLLLDENLSPRLVNRLNGLFPGLSHLRDVGLKRATDQQIWDWARDNAFAIITTDADFVALSQRHGWPPKVVHLEQCDFPSAVIEDWLRRSAVRISEFGKNDAVGLLSLRLRLWRIVSESYVSLSIVYLPSTPLVFDQSW